MKIKPNTGVPFETSPSFEEDMGKALDDNLRTHERSPAEVLAENERNHPPKPKRTSPAKRVKRAERIKKVLKDVEERKDRLLTAYKAAGGIDGLVDRAVLMPDDVTHKGNEYTGFSVSYYQLPINHPTTPGREPYVVECNDVIEALGMSYAEGNVFKALWRKCAARQGKSKRGYTDGKYDAEKMVFFSQRVLDDEITPKGNKA